MPARQDESTNKIARLWSRPLSLPQVLAGLMQTMGAASRSEDGNMSIYRPKYPGDLGPGYDAWRTKTPYDDEVPHIDSCPANDDAEQTYSECGGIGECICTTIEKAVNECVPLEGECICPTKEDIEQDKADAYMDRKNSGDCDD